CCSSLTSAGSASSTQTAAMGLTLGSPASLAFSLLFGRQPATVSEGAGPIIGLGTDPEFSESSRCGAPGAPDPPPLRSSASGFRIAERADFNWYSAWS